MALVQIQFQIFFSCFFFAVMILVVAGLGMLCFVIEEKIDDKTMRDKGFYKGNGLTPPQYYEWLKTEGKEDDSENWKEYFYMDLIEYKRGEKNV